MAMSEILYFDITRAVSEAHTDPVQSRYSTSDVKVDVKIGILFIRKCTHLGTSTRTSRSYFTTQNGFVLNMP